MTTNLIWLDLEMTGLQPDNHKIIEIACVITDKNLNVLEKSDSIAIYQNEKELEKMDDWNISTHTKSGLLERIKHHSISQNEAEQKILQLMQKWTKAKTSPLCGNSISQDRAFLYLHMKELYNHLHYRNLDVSTIKIIAQQMWFENLPHFEKENKHTALSDILESIKELQYYRNTVFNK